MIKHINKNELNNKCIRYTNNIDLTSNALIKELWFTKVITLTSREMTFSTSSESVDEIVF
jgi:hypothetical protein